MPIGMNSKGEIVGPPGWKPSPVPRDMKRNAAEIIISEYSCDSCGVIGETLYELRYGTGQRIGSVYCLACAEERRDELIADSA